jgi:hypothetical protein
VAVEVWRIYFVARCQHTKPEPKSKLVVIVLVDARPMGFLINTHVDTWIQIDPAKLATQARILASEHKCLDYDSHVDCMELFPFDETELTNPRDAVSPTAKASIQAAVASSKTLINRHKKQILKS